ncbi:hypothetical protein VTN00DRAFT_1001 [Thermoascus crustaceus]|uniref:uncharacterized protein n=1 Tax=Thermoascus crustaceus TaxID=5088 RepID=UPI0037434AA6
MPASPAQPALDPGEARAKNAETQRQSTHLHRLLFNSVLCFSPYTLLSIQSLPLLFYSLSCLIALSVSPGVLVLLFSGPRSPHFVAYTGLCTVPAPASPSLVARNNLDEQSCYS